MGQATEQFASQSDKVQYMTASILDLPAEIKAMPKFSHLFSAQCFCHCARFIKDILREAHSVLEKDGLMVINDFVVAESGPTKKSAAYFYKRLHFDHLLSFADYAEVLTESGFDIVTYENCSKHAQFGYETLFQVRMSAIEQKWFAQQSKRAKLMDTLLFQALMGMSVFALAWPGLIVLDALQWEPFEVPTVLECAALLCSTSMSMIYYGALLVGIAYKGALFMSTGVLLAIPAMFGVDMVVHGMVLTPFTVVGSLCIMIGFTVMQTNSKTSR